MVERVTNQMMQNNALTNIFRITNELEKTQNSITSGKRIVLPSDDPSGLKDSLQLHTSIDRITQFVRNIDFNRLTLSAGDSALNGIGTSLIRARELGVAQINGVSNSQTSQAAAVEVNGLIAQALQAANTQVKNQFIFAGTKIGAPPFSSSASGTVYAGNTEALQTQVADGYSLSLALPGSQVFGTDLNPILTNSTLLSSLNAGTGVPAGAFTIADRSGRSATINVAAGMTVGNLLSAINSSGINVTASINSRQSGVFLTDASGIINQGLTVADTGAGAIAKSLGILGRRDGNLDGLDLNPALTASSTLAQLNNGGGLSLSSINIVNGSSSGTITLSSANTIGDVINLINNSGMNVTASINSQGNALRVTSNNRSTVAVVSEVGNGTSAQDLGIGGGRNIFTTLVNLRDALNKNDHLAIIALQNNLNGGLSSVNSGRANIGAVLNQVQTTYDDNNQRTFNLNQQVSSIEDTDLVSAASHFAQMQTAFQATLNTSSRIIQPSILDFLR